MMVIWGADRPSLLWLMLTIVTMPVIELSPLSVNMPRLVDFSVLKEYYDASPHSANSLQGPASSSSPTPCAVGHFAGPVTVGIKL